MPLQMIELEEVEMFDVSDDALEAKVTGVGGTLNSCGAPWTGADCYEGC